MFWDRLRHEELKGATRVRRGKKLQVGDPNTADQERLRDRRREKKGSQGVKIEVRPSLKVSEERVDEGEGLMAETQ